jgi:hypothetical protein
MRHEAPRCIPSAAGRNSKGGSWVRWLTWTRKREGTVACQKSNGRVQASETRCCGTRAIWLNCAARRSVVFPAQLGGTRRNVLESDGLPRPERVLRDKSMPGKRRLCPDARSGAPRDSCDTVKAILPESQSPDDANIHPPERRLKPAPRPVVAFFRGRRNLRDVERCPVRVLKEMSGAPKSR